MLVLADDAPSLELPPPTGAPPVLLCLIPAHAGISLVALEPDVWSAIDRASEGATEVSKIGKAMAESLVDDEVLVAVAP
jgi:hypothetical protein